MLSTGLILVSEIVNSAEVALVAFPNESVASKEKVAISTPSVVKSAFATNVTVAMLLYITAVP